MYFRVRRQQDSMAKQKDPKRRKTRKDKQTATRSVRSAQRFVRRNGWVTAGTVTTMPGMARNLVVPLHCGGRYQGPYLNSSGPKLAVLRNANGIFSN